MTKKKFILGFILAACVLTCLACGKEPSFEVQQGQENQDEENIIYGYIRNGDKEDFLLSEFILILENDAAAIEKYQLSMDDFYFNDFGYVAYHREEGLLPKFENFEAGQNSQFYLLKDSFYPDYMYADLQEDRYVEVTRKDFKEVVGEDFYGFFKVKIYLEDGQVVRIEELNENEIYRKLYPFYQGPVLNNGSSFLKYEDSIYYREYSSESFEKTSLWGELNPVDGASTNIVKLGPDGSKEYLFSDESSGGFFIEPGKDGQASFIFDRKFVDEFQKGLKPYSLDFQGKNRKNYNEDKLGDILGKLWHYDPAANQIYYQDLEMKDYDYPLNIIRGDLTTGKTQLLFKPSREELELIFDDDYIGDYIKVENIRVSGDYFWAYLASYSGTAYMYDASALVKIPKNGGAFSYRNSGLAVDWYGLEKVYNQAKEGAFALTIPAYFIHPKEAPLRSDLVLSEDNMRELGYYNWPYGQADKLERIDQLEYVDGDLFFTVLSLIRNEEEDIGWREAYDRISADIFRKNIKTGEIVHLYSY